MLCPECKCPTPGGLTCPQCGNLVPERESFGGQGSHYLAVLTGMSLALVIVYLALASRDAGLEATIWRLTGSRWIWLYLLIPLTPLGIGVYYWALLREEEIVATDERIARTSHWGDEHLRWEDVRVFRRRPLLISQSRLGRITWLSRIAADSRLIWEPPPTYYELVGPIDESGNPQTMRLEPGTTQDLPWLLQIIEDRVGAPIEN